MILSCPQCSARFLVADRLIPPEGRVVKCGACSHQWHVDNPNPPKPEPEAEAAPADMSEAELEAKMEAALEQMQAAAASSASPAAPTKNVPAVAARDIPVKPLAIAFAAMFGLWVILAYMTYYPKAVHAPVVRSLYSMMGVGNTSGLAFVGVKMERDTEEARTRFILSGDIINRAKVARTVPEVRVALKDKNGKAVWTRIYPVNVKVEAGERYPFRITNVETSLADSVATITMDLGHPLQLSNR